MRGVCVVMLALLAGTVIGAETTEEMIARKEAARERARKIKSGLGTKSYSLLGSRTLPVRKRTNISDEPWTIISGKSGTAGATSGGESTGSSPAAGSASSSGVPGTLPMPGQGGAGTAVIGSGYSASFSAEQLNAAESAANKSATNKPQIPGIVGTPPTIPGKPPTTPNSPSTPPTTPGTPPTTAP